MTSIKHNKLQQWHKVLPMDTRHHALTNLTTITWMISSNPYHPLSLQRGNYSHMDGGIMDGWWRGIGDDDGDDLLQFPVPAGCQNGVSGGWDEVSLSLAVKRNSSLENVEPPMFLGHRQYVVRRRGREALGGGHTPPRRGLAWPAPGPGVGPPWVFSAPSSGSVGLRVKYNYWHIF